jgi:hypothetical protein
MLESLESSQNYDYCTIVFLSFLHLIQQFGLKQAIVLSTSYMSKPMV